MHIKTEQVERHTLAVIVDNEPGILARIAGLFTARGYNIESLTVSEITADKAVSRITIVTSASPPVMEQIIAQLDRLVPVHKVTDLTVLGDHVERELALVKVAALAVMKTARSPSSVVSSMVEMVKPAAVLPHCAACTCPTPSRSRTVAQDVVRVANGGRDGRETCEHTLCNRVGHRLASGGIH